jgi:hypothetical protein
VQEGSALILNKNLSQEIGSILAILGFILLVLWLGNGGSEIDTPANCFGYSVAISAIGCFVFTGLIITRKEAFVATWLLLTAVLVICVLMSTLITNRFDILMRDFPQPRIPFL